MKQKFTYIGLGVLGFCFGTILIFVVVHIVAFMVGPYIPFTLEGGLALFVFFSASLSIASGLFAAKSLMSRYSQKVSVNWSESRKAKFLLWAVLVLYIATWAVGVPAVQSSNSKWAIEEYKRINQGNNPRVSESHPYVRTYLAFPILPFVVVSYHEYQLAGLYGWGGWDFHLWYVKGSRSIFRATLWIS